MLVGVGRLWVLWMGRLTDCVANGPGDKVEGDGEGFLGLAGDVPRLC
jgi:hypothetical protein